MTEPVAKAYSQKALVVHWNVETNEVWLDTSGLSCFDVVGLLQVALDCAEVAIPNALTDYDNAEDSE